MSYPYAYVKTASGFPRAFVESALELVAKHESIAP